MTEQEFAAIRKRLGVMRDHPWKVEGYPLYTTQGHGISVWHPADGGIEGAANAPITSAVKAVPGDLETLIRAVEERDAIIHDLQLDGSALTRRAVEDFAAELWEWVNIERQRHQMTTDFDTGAACALAEVLSICLLQVFRLEQPRSLAALVDWEVQLLKPL